MRLLKPSVVAIGAPAVVAHHSSTGSALSGLGVNDVNAELAEETPAVSTDPIKPAPYLRDEIIPERPASLTPRETVRIDEPTTISGPSFLGLTGSDSDENSYLLEDDQPRSGARWALFFLVAIAIFVGIGYMEWNSIKSGKINVPFLKSASSEPATKPTSAASTANPASASTTPSQPDNADKLTTDDSGDNASDTENAKPTPAKPADETAATETAQSRQAKEAAARRNDPSDSKGAIAAKADDNGTTSSASETQAGKSKPSPRATTETAPNPQTNKMLVLGEKYLYGHGVARNCQQAMVYFRAAAADNNAPAMSHLGALYNSGECVKQDRAQAYSWLSRAHDADPSNQWIERDMNMLWRDMTTQERASISH